MFEDKIAALNQATDQQPIPFEKRTYTVPEIQDILESVKIPHTRS